MEQWNLMGAQPDERIKMNERETTTVPEEIKGCVCVHDIVPEIVPNPQGAMDAMKIRIIGHNIEEPHADDELFALLAGVPNAAIFASRILEAVSGANEFSQIMVAIGLSRELAEDQREQDAKADEPVTPSKGYAKNATKDDPIRLINLGDNPDGRPTMAPIDNRDEYKNIGGYL